MKKFGEISIYINTLFCGDHRAKDKQALLSMIKFSLCPLLFLTMAATTTNLRPIFLTRCMEIPFLLGLSKEDLDFSKGFLLLIEGTWYKTQYRKITNKQKNNHFRSPETVIDRGSMSFHAKTKFKEKSKIDQATKSLQVHSPPPY